MTPKSAKDRFLATLPPEDRAHNARILDRLSSSNPDDPIIAMFAILAESSKANAATIIAALGTAQIREKARDEEHTNIIRNEIGKLHPNGFWRRLVVSSLVTTIASIAIGIIVSTKTTSLVAEKMAGKSLALVAEQEAIFRNENEILDRIASNPTALVEFMKNGQTMAKSVAETAHAMAPFAAAMNQRGVVVRNIEGNVLLTYDGMQIKTTADGGSYICIPPPKNNNVSKPELDAEEVRKLEKRLNN